MNMRIIALVIMLLLGLTACNLNVVDNAHQSETSEKESTDADNEVKVETYRPELWENPVSEPIKMFY